jgi:hypothetical protein
MGMVIKSGYDFMKLPQACLRDQIGEAIRKIEEIS